MKTKIIEGKYFEKGEVLVEITNEFDSYVSSVIKIQNTIRLLKRREQEFVEKTKIEIDYNEAILTDLEKALTGIVYEKKPIIVDPVGRDRTHAEIMQEINSHKK